jgi:pyruvate dehydrogenase E1 component
MLHPLAPQKKSYLESVLQNEEGVFVAVSDYMKMVPDQIAPWIPGGLMSLGTDGFGRSDTRPTLRRFFEVDAESTAVATLYALYQKGALPAQTVDAAIKKLGINPEKSSPFYL